MSTLANELEQITRQGFVLLESVLAAEEIAALVAALELHERD